MWGGCCPIFTCATKLLACSQSIVLIDWFFFPPLPQTVPVGLKRVVRLCPSVQSTTAISHRRQGRPRTVSMPNWTSQCLIQRLVILPNHLPSCQTKIRRAWPLFTILKPVWQPLHFYQSIQFWMCGGECRMPMISVLEPNDYIYDSFSILGLDIGMPVFFIHRERKWEKACLKLLWCISGLIGHVVAWCKVDT